jgi:glycosyltransferase involved in cell wall biosynthesis
LRRRFFDEDDILLLGMVGRIHPNKGQLDVVRAAREFIDQEPRARVVIIGEPQRGFEDYAEQLRTLIEELDLSARVRVTNVLRDEVPAALAGMDVFLAPSYIESFSFAILEAMAMGKPVIASNAGGNPELVLDGVSGELVPAGDCQALAAAVGGLLADADKRARMGASGRHRVESELNLPSMRQRTYSVYREVIDWRSRNSATRSDLRARLAALG